MKKLFLIAPILCFLLPSCTFEKAEALTVGCDATMSYAADIKPFMDSKCMTCHSNIPSYLNAADFTDFNILKSKINDGTFKTRVFTIKDMAPAGYDQLTETESGKLKCWLEQGAPNN